MNDKKDAVAKQVDDIIVDSKSEKAYEDFIKICTKMGENIRDEQFEDVLQIVKNANMTFSIDALRTTFIESVTDILKKMYETRDLKKKLTVIHLLEEQYKKRKSSHWHPHGKTPEQQTIPNRINILNKRKNFMVKLLAAQQTLKEETRIKIDENRKRMQEISSKRKELSLILNKKLEKLKSFEEECTRLELVQADHFFDKNLGNKP